MELIKKYKVVIAIVLIVLVLVVIRSVGSNHFKNDAKKWAEPSGKQSNTISIEQSSKLSGRNLIINLDKDDGPLMNITSEIENIPADSILSKDYIKLIMKHEGPVLLFSSDPGKSARIWMILSQMGCKRLYILTRQTDNEFLKYKFRPDTLTH